MQGAIGLTSESRRMRTVVGGAALLPHHVVLIVGVEVSTGVERRQWRLRDDAIDALAAGLRAQVTMKAVRLGSPQVSWPGPLRPAHMSREYACAWLRSFCNLAEEAAER